MPMHTHRETYVHKINKLNVICKNLTYSIQHLAVFNLRRSNIKKCRISSKNLTMLLKHSIKHAWKDNSCRCSHTRDSSANATGEAISHWRGGQRAFPDRLAFCHWHFQILDISIFFHVNHSFLVYGNLIRKMSIIALIKVRYTLCLRKQYRRGP